MKAFDRLMPMNDMYTTEASSSSRELRDNKDEPDLQGILIAKAYIL